MAKPIKILATSDTHGCLDGIKEEIGKFNPHIVVFAGDIAPASIWMIPSDYFNTTFLNLVKCFPKIDFVYTPGNHDLFTLYYEDPIEKHQKQIPPNFHFLRQSTKTIRGLKFCGTPYVPYINGRWAYETENEEEERMRYGFIPEGIDILVSHTPPLIRHQKIDVSIQRKASPHFGSAVLWDKIKAVKPRYVICGHIHSGDHKPFHFTHNEENGNETIVVNVSRVDERYIKAYDCHTFEISPSLS